MATFLRNAWYVAGWSASISESSAMRIQILGNWIALFRGEGGTVQAISDRCPHRFASLSSGRVVGEALQCPYHGLHFDGKGQCVRNPHGDGTVPPQASVRHYPVTERYGAVWVWTGDQRLADPDNLPDLSTFEDDLYSINRDYLRVDGPYGLVIDNLLDLSHIAFLHPALASADAFDRSRVATRQEGETVWHDLDVLDEPVSPLFDAVWDDEVRIGTTRSSMRWNAPSHLFLDVSATPIGSTSDDFPRLPSAHLLTPETETSTHYFWMIGRNRRQCDSAVGERLREMIGHAFRMEDEPMIERVHANMEGVDFWSLRPVILSGDRAAVQARRILDKKIRQENAATAD